MTTQSKSSARPNWDEVLKEIFRIKDKQSLARGHSVDRLFDEARERQNKSGKLVVNFSRSSSGALQETADENYSSRPRKTPIPNRADDEVLREVWKNRDKMSAEAGFDVDRLFDQLRERQKTSGHKVVSFAKKPHNTK